MPLLDSVLLVFLNLFLRSRFLHLYVAVKLGYLLLVLLVQTHQFIQLLLHSFVIDLSRFSHFSQLER